MSAEDKKEDDAAMYFDGDIAMSRFEPSLTDFEGDDEETRGTQNFADKIAEELMREVDDFLSKDLSKDEVYPRKELDALIRKLDVASTINNDPKARELREMLIKKYDIKKDRP